MILNDRYIFNNYNCSNSNFWETTFFLYANIFWLLQKLINHWVLKSASRKENSSTGIYEPSMQHKANICCKYEVNRSIRNTSRILYTYMPVFRPASQALPRVLIKFVWVLACSQAKYSFWSVSVIGLKIYQEKLIRHIWLSDYRKTEQSYYPVIIKFYIAK